MPPLLMKKTWTKETAAYTCSKRQYPDVSSKMTLDMVMKTLNEQWLEELEWEYMENKSTCDSQIHWVPFLPERNNHTGKSRN